MSYIGNQITGFLGTGSLTVTTSTVAVEGDALFSADGNVVLGDASGDTITINAATASIPNNLNIDSNTLFLDAANNRIGIGTSSPDMGIHLSSGGTNYLRVTNTSTGVGSDFGTSSTGTEIINRQSAPIRFQTNATERMRIDSSGNVGIGKSSPDRLMHLASSAAIICIEDTAGATDDKRAQIQVDNGQFEINSRNDDNSSRTDNIFVADLGTGNIGIGTNSPYGALTVDTANGILNIANGNTSGGTKIQAWGATPSNGYLAIEGYTKEYMRITSDGSVGIGTSSPAYKLDVQSSSDPAQIRLKEDGNTNGFIINNYDGNEAQLVNADNGPMVFKTNNTERMRITSGGLVGIGTNSPDKALTISASDSQIRLYDADGTNQFAAFQSDNGTTKITSRNNTSNGAIAFQKFDGTTVSESMRIDSSGNVGIGTTSTTNDAKLIVSGTDGKHPVIKVDDGGSNGYTLLADNYTATQSQVNFGIAYSSASAVISKGVKVSDTTDDVYLSSQALYATKPTAFKLGNDGSFRFLNTDTSATTAVDTAVTLTERMRIKSNGQVGIGTSSPSNAKTVIVTDGTDGANEVALALNHGDGGLATNQEVQLNFGQGSNANISLAQIAGAYAGGTFDGNLVFKTNSGGVGNLTERMRILSGGGITFNGDTAAANALSDYEEGTWTPTAVTNIDSISLANGHYTKVGNLVTVNFYARLDPSNTTSSMTIGGLPYSVADQLGSTNVEYTGVVFEDSSIFLIWPQGAASNINIEFDRPIQGSANAGAANYRGSVTYAT